MAIAVSPRSLLPRAITVLAISLATIQVACSDAGTGPITDPLAGLAQTTRNDTATAPPTTTAPTPGSFVGTVYGYVPGPGTDTLQTSERLQGVQVTAFVRAEVNGATAAGSEVASATTDAMGYFQLPTLPGGEYVVTFVVPQGSIYRSSWTVGMAWEGSANSPWFIMLPARQ
jgi:hypothetical protein